MRTIRCNNLRHSIEHQSVSSRSQYLLGSSIGIDHPRQVVIEFTVQVRAFLYAASTVIERREQQVKAVHYP